MIHTALMREPTGVNVFGEITWSVPVSFLCRVEMKMKQAIDQHGQEFLSECQLFAERPIAIGAQIQLPNETIYRAVRAVERSMRKDGSFTFWEVAF